jgi:hypothetical protein
METDDHPSPERPRLVARTHRSIDRGGQGGDAELTEDEVREEVVDDAATCHRVAQSEGSCDRYTLLADSYLSVLVARSEHSHFVTEPNPRCAEVGAVPADPLGRRGERGDDQDPHAMT